MRGIIRQFKELPRLSQEEKKLLSLQLENLTISTHKKTQVIQRFRNRYYEIEDSLNDELLLGLAGYQF